MREILGIDVGSLREVVHDPANQRLWLLSREKNIFTAGEALQPSDFETVLKTGTTWSYFDLGADLRQAMLSDDGTRLYLGSAGYGAAAYHIPSHTWLPFAGASDSVRYLLPHEQTIWVAGNAGVHAFDQEEGDLDSTRSLNDEAIRHFAFGPGLQTVVNEDDALFVRRDETWATPFGGGQGLSGITATDITQALLTPDHHLVIAAEGHGLARYDTTTHRWHTLTETDQRYRQLAILNDQLIVAADTGLRVLSYQDALAPTRTLNNTQRVTLRHNNAAQLFYTTQDQALWHYNTSQPRQLIDAPPEISTPGAVRDAVAARRGTSPGFWLTTDQGLLRYDTNTHRLEQGTYSSILGWNRPIDQLFPDGNGLLARVGERIYSYTGLDWQLERSRFGTRHVIPVANAQFFFLKNNGVLESTTISEQYFNGQAKPLRTALDPTGGGQPGAAGIAFQGEVDPASGSIYLALPGEAVWAYRGDRQRWDRLVSSIPADLQSMHWTSRAWSLVTQGGHLYIANDTAYVSNSPDFSSAAIPAPLDRVVDIKAVDNEEQVLLAWPDRLALYNPGTGRWQEDTPRHSEADPFEQLVEWRGDLYARTAMNLLWKHEEEKHTADTLWHRASFTDSTIAKLAFGDANIWYRFDDNTGGRYEKTYDWNAQDSTERFFTGSFPGLDSATHLINEDDRFAWALSDQGVGRYDAEQHEWLHRPFPFANQPGEGVRQALFADEALFVITNRRLLRFEAGPDHITAHDTTFTGTSPMLLAPDGGDLTLWLNKGRRIEQFDVLADRQQQPGRVFEGGRFEGNLNQLIDAREHDGALWVMDSAGRFGFYEPQTQAWRNHRIPRGETPVRFIPLKDHLILETHLTDETQRHLYRYEAPRDTLHRFDACSNRPTFRYYADGPLLLTCEDGTVAQVEERPTALQINPLPTLTGATRLDYLYTSDSKRALPDMFVGLFADSTGARRVLYGDALAISLPASASDLTALTYVARDLTGRLWILGDNQRLYVARFEDLSATDRESLDLRHFERKLSAGTTAIDFGAELWGGQAPAITGFAAYDYDARRGINMWITTPGQLYQFHVPVWRLPSEVRQAKLPQEGQRVQHLYVPQGRDAIVVQEDAYYQLRSQGSWWRRPFSLVAGYNLGDWEALDAAPTPPQAKPQPLDAGYAPQTTDQTRWRITRTTDNTLRFAYRLGSSYKNLRHDAHTFLKDHILHAAAGRGKTYLHTRDGLLVYNLGSQQVDGELRTTSGQPLIGLDTLVSKPTRDTGQQALWARHEGQWKQVVIEDMTTARLVPGDYAYDVRRTAEAVVWQQATPTTTTFTLGETSAVTQGRLVTDVLVDMALLDTMIFYSTPAGLWQGTEDDEVSDWQFTATLPNARFQKTADNRLFAHTQEGLFELFVTGRTEALDALPADTTSIRRDIALDGTRWQLDTRRPGLRVSSGTIARRQDPATGAFTDDIVRDAAYDEDRAIYWVASQGGLWRFDARIGRADREIIFAPNIDFRRFFKNDRLLYAIDADDQVYTLEAGAWQRDPNITAGQLSKTLDNGRVRFAQNHTNSVRLTRMPGQGGPVWTQHQDGWHLAGDALENAERVDNSLWTYAPDLGFARYAMGDFAAAEAVVRPAAPMPEQVDFFTPAHTDTLYVRDRATSRFWRLIGTRMEQGMARDWESPYNAASEGQLAWERSSPDSPTLTLKINDIPLSTTFSNRRLAFDDYRSVFAVDANTIYLGNDMGLFAFTLTPAQDLRLRDYFPLPEGVQAITEANDQLYIRTRSGETHRFDPTRKTFTPTPDEGLFLQAQPVLDFEDNRFVLRTEDQALPLFTGRLAINVASNRPLFTPKGTFGFDAYMATLPLSDSTWLGATAWGLVEAATTAEGTHHPIAFYAFDDTFEGSAATIVDIRKQDDAVYLHGQDVLGREVFFAWQGARAQPYDENTRRIFSHPQVTFHPHDVKWNQKSVAHTEETALQLVGDPSYPLYIEDEDEPGRGRFAFDDIQSIWAHDNVLWAGSKGGLLQFRYLPEHTQQRLVFETIYTEQTNLAAYHVMDVQRGARAGLSIDLREQTPGDSLIKQTLVPGDWKILPTDTTLRTQRTVGTLTVKQDALGFRTRLHTNGHEAALDGYALSLGKTARLGDTIYFVATDSLVFAYDVETNTSARVEEVYAEEADQPVASLTPPLALAQYENTVILRDGAVQFFAMQPGIRIDTLAAHTALFGTHYATVGDIDVYIQEGQLVLDGAQIPRLQVANSTSRYAVAAYDGQLVLYTDPEHYTLWSFDEGLYSASSGSGAAFMVYEVRPGDTIYRIIERQGLATGQAGDPDVEHVKTQIVDRNRGNAALYFEGGDARLRVRGRIEIPTTPTTPHVRRPTQGYLYWSARDSVRLETPSVDLLTRALYAEDSALSILWTGERFVEVERKRNLAQQYYPPDSVAVWSLRYREDDTFILIPHSTPDLVTAYYERERLRLRPWEEPGWDPFLEHRVTLMVKGESVGYRVTPRRLLEREGTLIRETDDWQQNYPIRRIVALEKSNQDLWVATRDRLIRIRE